ncbi:hypothetical protein LIA77_07434 [Sarocladium implicatum]|nr:hypothetical protein LIA77_07434 [Sarocladium implicatum]
MRLKVETLPFPCSVITRQSTTRSNNLTQRLLVGCFTLCFLFSGRRENNANTSQHHTGEPEIGRDTLLELETHDADALASLHSIKRHATIHSLTWPRDTKASFGNHGSSPFSDPQRPSTRLQFDACSSHQVAPFLPCLARDSGQVIAPLAPIDRPPQDPGAPTQGKRRLHETSPVGPDHVKWIDNPSSHSGTLAQRSKRPAFACTIEQTSWPEYLASMEAGAQTEHGFLPG